MALPAGTDCHLLYLIEFGRLFFMAYFNFLFFGQLLNWESKLEKRSCPCLKGLPLAHKSGPDLLVHADALCSPGKENRHKYHFIAVLLCSMNLDQCLCPS